MDEAKSLRGDAEVNDARQEQAIKDADNADRDGERSRSEAADYATEAASQRQEADALETPTDGLDFGDEISVLRGRAEDNDLRERNSIKAAEVSEARALQLRGEAAGYGGEASSLRSDADTTEAQSKQEDEDKLGTVAKVVIAAEVIRRLDDE